MTETNPAPLVESFFHKDTNTFTHVVYDHEGGGLRVTLFLPATIRQERA